MKHDVKEGWSRNRIERGHSDEGLEGISHDNNAARAKKSIVLALLVFQNVASILSMKKASRQKSSDGLQANTMCIVLLSELVKVIICLAEIFVR